MFPHNEYVLNEDQRMRRQEMMREAAMERMLRQRSTDVSWFDVGLAAVGRLMVQAGRRLERRSALTLRSA